MHRQSTHNKYPTPVITVVAHALVKSVLHLHGLPPHPECTTGAPGAVVTIEIPLFSSDREVLGSSAEGWAIMTFLLWSSRAHRVSVIAFQARRKRKMKARTIRKMHVPAYCPSVVGVHEAENSGWLVVWVKTMGITVEDMSILAEDEDEESMFCVKSDMRVEIEASVKYILQTGGRGERWLTRTLDQPKEDGNCARYFQK
jgi:hypothetical protein